MSSTTIKIKPLDLRIIISENKIKQECIDKGQPYINPVPDIYREPANERKVRMKRMRISFLDDETEKQRKEKNRIATRKRRQDIKNGRYTPRIPTAKKNKLEERSIQICCPGHDTKVSTYNYRKVCCDKSEWSAAPYCKDVKVPSKEKIEITGINGYPIYASAYIKNAKYIIGGDDLTLDNDVQYCKREVEGAVKHMFSLVFKNLMVDGWRYECTIDEILKCEIRINGIIIGTMMDSTRPTAHLCQQYDDYLCITHQFAFEHGTTTWGYYESFNLKLLYGPLPKDITTFMNNSELDNFNYGQITRKGISSIKFVDINFRETNMNRDKGSGKYVHYVAWKELYQKKVEKQMTSGDLHRAWRQSIEDEKKVLYWKCLKGYQSCHEWKGRVCRCRECIAHFNHRFTGEYHNGEQPPSKEDFPLCSAGHNMCHDGILQCPECKRANIPQNKPRWIYRDYIKGAFITKVFPTYEECNQYEWAEKRRNGTYLNW